MRVYSPVALLLLTAIAFWMLPGIGTFRPEMAARIVRSGGFGVVEEVIARSYRSSRGLSRSRAWQASTGEPGPNDVGTSCSGGLTGIVLAAAWTAVMSLS